MYLNKSFFEIENRTGEYSQANESASNSMAGWKKKYLILFQVLMRVKMITLSYKTQIRKEGIKLLFID